MENDDRRSPQPRVVQHGRAASGKFDSNCCESPTEATNVRPTGVSNRRVLSPMREPVVPHGADPRWESERIDCAKCGSVFGFSKWQGQTLATLKPPGLARNAED